LPTAELTFEGAKGWPVGPVDAGLKNMVGIVLTASRVYNTLAGAAGLRRAVRDARAYADFRQAFGRRLADHPLLAASLARLERAADRYSAGAFATVDRWLDAQKSGVDPNQKLWSRLLISMAKSVTARDTVGLVYEAMMVLGGNGIEERFCALPRLWRDAAIMETWEGPYTLLLMQALGDMVKFEVAGREQQLLRFGLGDHLQSEDAQQLAEILAAPERADHIEAWAELANRIYGCFCDRALDEIQTAGR
jgi:alkylation response protein AidB-like acyl-CoA dehydrogenase